MSKKSRPRPIAKHRAENRFLKLQHPFIQPLIIAALVFIVYSPVFQAGFIWEDYDFVLCFADMTGWEGLANIWTEPRKETQYHPLTVSVFWLQYQIWGNHATGYHVFNIFLHSLNAILLFFLLKSWKISTAWLAAIVFAIHPVHVRSVAAIAEIKNLFSGVFYFLTFLVFLRYHPPDAPLEQPNSKKFYYLSFFLFVLALLAKPVTCILPVVIGIMYLWKKGKLTRPFLLSLVPFLIAGLFFALLTIVVENVYLIAQGNDWHLSFIERCLIASRAIWFYIGKLLYPHPLLFFYPQWTIDIHSPAQWIPPIAFFLFLFALFVRKGIKRNRTLLAAFFIYLAHLFPAMGFFDIYAMSFTYVADHWQYLASISILVFFISASNVWLSRVKALKKPLAILLILVCSILTWNRAKLYQSEELLYRTTVKYDPDSMMGNYFLGYEIMKQGRHQEAIPYFESAIANKARYFPPLALIECYHHVKDYDRALQAAKDNLLRNPNCGYYDYLLLGLSYRLKGDYKEAIDSLKRALILSHENENILLNLGLSYYHSKNNKGAIKNFERLLEINPRHADALKFLGNAYTKEKNFPKAVDAYQKALSVSPQDSILYKNLGLVFEMQGDKNAAFKSFQQALKYNPRLIKAHDHLATLYFYDKDWAKAQWHLQQILKINPNHSISRQRLEYMTSLINKPPPFESPR